MWNGQEVKIAFEKIEPTIVKPYAYTTSLYRITQYKEVVGYYSSLSLFVGEVMKNPSDFIGVGVEVVSVEKNNHNNDLSISYWKADCVSGNCEHYDDDKQVPCSEVEIAFEDGYEYEVVELHTDK